MGQAVKVMQVIITFTDRPCEDHSGMPCVLDVMAIPDGVDSDQIMEQLIESGLRPHREFVHDMEGNPV